MSSVDIVECSTPTELVKQYPDQLAPQPAYIELDLRADRMLAEHQDEIGGAVPMGVYHGFLRRYDIPILTGEAANRLMRKLAPLAERVLSDWHEHWDGNNHVAVLGDDACAAEEAIADLTAGESFSERDVVACWEVAEAVNGEEIDEYGITGATSNERLQEIADEIVDELANNSLNSSGIAVCPGMIEHLQMLRDRLVRETTSG